MRADRSAPVMPLSTATKPAKLAYAMADSPVGVAAWIIEAFHAWSDLRDTAFEDLYTPDQLLTEVMLYLVTDAFPTSTWIYGAKRHEETTLPPGRRVEVPTAVAAFHDPVFPHPLGVRGPRPLVLGFLERPWGAWQRARGDPVGGGHQPQQGGQLVALARGQAGEQLRAVVRGDLAQLVEQPPPLRGEVQVTGTMQFAAAVPLAVLAATAASRLQHLGVRAPGVTIAVGGGTFSAAFLALSGLLQWTLSRPAVQAEPGVVRALHDLTFITGGPAHAVGLGLLVAGIAVPALLFRLLPRWMGVVGLAIAVLAELSTLVLIAPAAVVLIPLSRFPALLWLVGAAALLPRNRANASASNLDATRR